MEEQLETLIEELRLTRGTFDRAVSTIHWNKINTIIQYVALAMILILGAVCFVWYLDEKHDSCVEHNDIRRATVNEMESTAAAIGIALQTVSGADHAQFQLYMETYIEQAEHEDLVQREC